MTDKQEVKPAAKAKPKAKAKAKAKAPATAEVPKFNPDKPHSKDRSFDGVIFIQNRFIYDESHKHVGMLDTPAGNPTPVAAPPIAKPAEDAVRLTPVANTSTARVRGEGAGGMTRMTPDELSAFSKKAAHKEAKKSELKAKIAELSAELAEL